MDSRTPRSASAIFVGVVALALLFESVLRGAVAWERSFNPDEFQHVQRAWR